MTYAVQGALQKAVEISKEYELQNIENEALLKATLEESESLFKSVLERANIDVDQLTKAYEDKLKIIHQYKEIMYNTDNILVRKPMNY